MTTTAEQIRDIGQRWAEAEEHADVNTLSSLTTNDFTLVGPVGFVLDKQQWLDRYRSGALETKSLKLEDVNVRDYGDAAVAIGTEKQQASYQGNQANGDFRITQLFVRDGSDWSLAGIHLSPMGGRPPFARQNA